MISVHSFKWLIIDFQQTKFISSSGWGCRMVQLIVTPYFYFGGLSSPRSLNICSSCFMNLSIWSRLEIIFVFFPEWLTFLPVSLLHWEEEQQSSRRRGSGRECRSSDRITLLPGFYLTRLIIALIVEIKVQLSEVHYNTSHSDDSGNAEWQKAAAMDPTTLTSRPFLATVTS